MKIKREDIPNTSYFRDFTPGCVFDYGNTEDGPFMKIDSRGTSNNAVSLVTNKLWKFSDEDRIVPLKNTLVIEGPC